MIETNQPVTINVRHDDSGYASPCGLQIVFKGPADANHNGLPDAWENLFFGNLNQTAAGDFDSDGLNNLAEYRLSLDPTRADTDSDSLNDAADPERSYIDEETPLGASTGGSNEGWNWTDYWWDGDGWGSGEILPSSWNYFHVSDYVPGDFHEHYFYGANAVMSVNPGDVLICYINLDSTYPPDEVVLQWETLEDDGNASWEHRAYWGSDSLGWAGGVLTSANYYYMGGLPDAGNWVRLEVPASAVGLEGKIVQGISFGLWGGRAAWDRAGKLISDLDGNGLPDDWERQYFGCIGVDPDSDADGDGVSNLQEYLWGTDPNKIRFFLSVTNQYVNTTGAPVQLNVLGGVPSYIAMLVNDTNAADISWQPFTSTSLWVPTPTNGVYVIAVGLRGLPTVATQSWQSVTILRDTTPLILALTNLAALSGSRPFVDPAGYATRGLSAVTWSVVDGNGLTNSGKGAVVAKGWNLPDQFHTTNWFQCLDLALALGTNSISIQAVDWAGNVAMTNFAYVFDTNGDTMPPALTLLWPQDNTQVSGNNFTVQAWMDDDTATVALQYTDTAGIVQTMNGLVERGGNVWGEGVPLAPGTNLLTLTATDAAGNVSTTNFSVVQSSEALTVAPLSQDQMQYGYATVMVMVDASASVVTVNGVPGTNYDGQTWEVDNVPLPPGGTVTLQATAQLAGGGTLQVLLEQEREPIVFTQVFDYKVLYTFSTGSRIALRDIPFHWVRGSGCAPSFTYSEFNLDTGNTATHEDAFTWPADNGYLPSLPGQRAFNDYVNGVLWHSFTQVVNPPAVERVDISTSWGRWPDNCHAYWRESSGVEVRLFTGGKALRKGQGLFDLSAGLAYADCLDTAVSSWCASSYDGLFLWLDYPPVAVPSEEIALGALGNLGSDGHLWTVQQDGIEVIITPQVSSCRSASALPISACGPFTNVTTGARGDKPGQQKYKLRIYFGDQDIRDTNVTALVGQMITLSCGLVPNEGSPPITNVLWTVPSTALSNFFVSADGLQTNGYPVLLTDQQKTSNTVRFCWVDRGAKSVTCKAEVAGEEFSAETTFGVKRPNATLTATIQSGVEVWNNQLRFQNSFIDGITFMIRDKDTDGDWQYIQIGHPLYRHQNGADGTWFRNEGRGLDGHYPNPNDRDSPSTELLAGGSRVTATGTFTTYLAFRATPSDVLVPIREITWSWDGQAATNGIGEWTGGGTPHVDSHDTEAPSTISWTNSVKATLDIPVLEP